MDYYNLSVFEFVTDQLGAQGTVCAGGRYDGLMAQVGGKPTPAVGWALGMERILELLRAQAALPNVTAPDAYAVVPQAAAADVVSRVLRVLRSHGVSVQMHAATAEGQGSMKSQFKKADASGARYALVFGEDEMAAGQVSVKPLRDGPNGISTQTLFLLDEAARWASALRA
jgi:histidyl-tRNA synthetase